ncbi:TetR/AcrR family transcriptional regulator [Streptosporangium saharense]|uniref:AcrR family transcriptional regulator n=1 Tax=Streptosporangium saharense TaxID=1706840 RepID=A0A7W7VLN1_9ACTN|nr:TetR/AcrR family transcriptional regulator [Streptosporangium saharense]MBB4914847.1 AcrR family transcriptional regulator [Streptosporangium saharense]
MLERPKRADARRNHDRILAAAQVAVARDGADASLEEIARQAGVGSATLHRHFPSRLALLEAVFLDRVETLCSQARELAADPDPGAALVTWLRAIGAYAANVRGLAASLLRSACELDHAERSVTCHGKVSDAGEELLSRARQAGAVRPDVSVGDLLTLVNALSLATERHPDPCAETDRLLLLALEGIGP